jgi:hypothetical protein
MPVLAMEWRLLGIPRGQCPFTTALSGICMTALARLEPIVSVRGKLR